MLYYSTGMYTGLIKGDQCTIKKWHVRRKPHEKNEITLCSSTAGIPVFGVTMERMFRNGEQH